MFKQNFIKLCKEKHVSPSAVCISCGLSNATFTSWTDDSVPRPATLQKIADYFGVTPEDLLSSDVCCKERDELIHLIRSMTADQIRSVADYASYIKENR